MIRRGFTLIEVTLAAALGAGLMLVVIAILAAVGRTDELTQRQFEGVAAVQRLHLIMERAFYTPVMSEIGSGSDPNTQDAGAAVAAQGIRQGEAATPRRPRVILETDASTRLASTGTPWAGVDPAGTPTPVQRLEIVTLRPLVPPGFREGLDNADLVQPTSADELPPAAATRQVFELRPDWMTPRAAGAPRPDPATSGWTLWWRPLPPDTEGANAAFYATDPTEDPRAVPLASGLAGLQWTAFKQKERLSSITATQLIDLPGYFEIQLRTTAGHYANWMFEVGGQIGPESLDEASPDGTSSPDGDKTGTDVGPGGDRGGDRGRPQPQLIEGDK